MKQLSKALVASAMIVSAPMVQADSPHEFSANIALSTDYLFRGISQTNGNPALSGGFDYSYAPVGIYAGVWASNVEFGDDSTLEVDFYGGIAGDFGSGVSWDIGGLYYHYPASDASDIDYFEVYGSLGYTFEGVSLEPSVGVAVSYSPDWTLTPGMDSEAIYINPTLGLSLPMNFGLGFSYGYQDVDDLGDYSHIDISLTKEISKFEFGLTYSNKFGKSDFCAGLGDLCDDTVVFSISSSF